MAIQKPKFQILDNPLLVNMEFPKLISKKKSDVCYRGRMVNWWI